MNIVKATEDYESWLGTQLRLVPEDLELKHRRMGENAFAFLRATFYRWIQIWPTASADLDKAPKVLAVGDLHLENFGTWRDIEGRLVWGINDFDEACELPYTQDLVRLAASTHLAIADERVAIERKDACDRILEGYRKSLEEGGAPLVLAENHGWLRQITTGVLRDPERFWAKMDALPTLPGKVPPNARRAIERMLPEVGLECRYVHRIAGLGSLGRERYVGIAVFRGARIAREAKALAPSAAVWAGVNRAREIRYQEIVDKSIRCSDPFVKLQGKWIVRRLAPDCSRVELASLVKERDESKLLFHMGHETANAHLGSGNRRRILADLDRRKPGWLHSAAEGMLEFVNDDWQRWRSRPGAAG